MNKLLALFAVLLIVEISTVHSSYSQWMDLTIWNKGPKPIRVTGKLTWGKFYKDGNKDKETSAPSSVVAPGESLRVSACGRSDAASGTSGNIYILSADSNKELVDIQFSSPYSGSSSFIALVKDQNNVAVSHSNWQPSKNLGEMSIRIFQV